MIVEEKEISDKMLPGNLSSTAQKEGNLYSVLMTIICKNMMYAELKIVALCFQPKGGYSWHILKEIGYIQINYEKGWRRWYAEKDTFVFPEPFENISDL